MQLDRETLRAMRVEIITALNETVGKKHGVTFDLGNCRFDSYSARWTQLTAKQASAAEVKAIESDAAELFKAHARSLGLKPEWFGRVVTMRGIAFKISGVNPSRPKRCLQITRMHDGKGYICAVEDVKYLLEAVDAATKANKAIAKAAKAAALHLSRLLKPKVAR